MSCQAAQPGPSESACCRNLLSSKLSLQVEKANDCIGEEVAQKAKALKNGQVGMAEASAAFLL